MQVTPLPARRIDLEKQTETLKLVFTLYFRILKDPSSAPLLPAALHGISKFAHLVNVDFFKDLMAVLKKIISPDEGPSSEVTSTDQLHIRLLCIVTAFELLSGQGPWSPYYEIRPPLDNDIFLN